MRTVRFGWDVGRSSRFGALGDAELSQGVEKFDGSKAVDGDECVRLGDAVGESDRDRYCHESGIDIGVRSVHPVRPDRPGGRRRPIMSSETP